MPGKRPAMLLDLPDDLQTAIIGRLDKLKDRVCTVSCNRQLAVLGRSESCLWEEVDFPGETNPGTAGVWLAAKRSIVRKADLWGFTAADAVYLLGVLAGSAVEELSLDLAELTHFDPNVLQLPRLRKLSIDRSCNLLGLELQGSFSHLRHLSSLQLSDLSFDTMDVLGLPNLQQLSCKNAVYHLTGLGQATSLRSLTLDMRSAESLPGQLLPELPALEHLSFRGLPTAAVASTANWEGFPQLRSLSLHAWCSEPLDLLALTGQLRLEVLDISESILKPLPQSRLVLPALTKLQQLSVDDVCLADNLALLDCLPSLKVLHLAADHIRWRRASDAQWDALLSTLALAVPSLESLKVDAYKAMARKLHPTRRRASFKRLQKARPTLRVMKSTE